MAASQDILGHPSDYARGVVMVLTAGVFWSIAGLVIRHVESANEWQILFYRSVVLVATLGVYLMVSKRGRLLDAFLDAGFTAYIAGFFLGLGFACWIFALTHTTVANALFVLSATPFIAAILGRLVLGETVRRGTWLCMALAIAGVGLMIIEAAYIGTISGNLYALGAATGFALFAVALRRGRANDMTPAVCWAGIWASLFGMIMIGATASSFHISAHDLQMCAIMGFVQLGCGLIIFTKGSRYISAAEISLLSLTEVVLGPVWVWLGVGEVPTFYTLVGGAVVLSAIVLQALSGMKTPAPAPIV